MAKAITVDEIKENMILAEPVINKFGQTLIAPGSELTERHKSTLKTWNIKVVFVKSSIDDEVSISEEMLSAARNRVLARMDWRPATPLEEDLLEAAAITLALRISNEKKGSTE